MEVPVDDVDDHEDGGEEVEQLGALLHQTRAVAHVDESEALDKYELRAIMGYLTYRTPRLTCTAACCRTTASMCR